MQERSGKRSQEFGPLTMCQTRRDLPTLSHCPQISVALALIVLSGTGAGAGAGAAEAKEKRRGIATCVNFMMNMV